MFTKKYRKGFIESLGYFEGTTLRHEGVFQK